MLKICALTIIFFHRTKLKIKQLFTKPTTDMIAYSCSKKQLGEIVSISKCLGLCEILFKDDSIQILPRKDLLFIPPKFKVGDNIKCKNIETTPGIITSISRKFVGDEGCYYRYDIYWDNSVPGYLYETEIKKVRRKYE